MNTRTETVTDHLFATPVIRHAVADADALNAELRRAILARMATDPSGIARSNTGGWHSDTDMMEWAPGPSQRLFGEAIGAFGPLMADLSSPKRQFGFAGDIWANVSGPGHSNQTHTHPGALWSGVYYVDPGHGLGSEGVEGELVLEDPRYPTTEMYMPSLLMRGADGEPVRSQHGVVPRAGLMVLFPSWLRHSVRPYRGTGQRISVAFNIRVIVEGVQS